MTDLDSRLNNWARAMRSNPRGYCSLLGTLYVRNPFEADEEGNIIARPEAPKIPIDVKDALIVEGAILRLPREPYNSARLLVYHYITPWLDIHKACRKIGVRVYRYQESVNESLDRLGGLLTQK